MASPSQSNQENIKSFLVSNLQQVLRNLEQNLDANILDYSLYKLQQSIELCIQCNSFKDSDFFVNDEFVNVLLVAYDLLEEDLQKEVENQDTGYSVVEGYDNHPIRSASNMTPAQLWLQGCHAFDLPQQETSEDNKDWSLYGIDWEGPLPSKRYSQVDLSDDAVVVPVLNYEWDNLTPYLVEEIHPLDESGDPYGIDVYLHTRSFVRSQIQQTN
eukprot:gene14418-15925_t